MLTGACNQDVSNMLPFRQRESMCSKTNLWPVFNSTSHLRDLLHDFQQLLGEQPGTSPLRQSPAQQREKIRKLVDEWLNQLVGMEVDVP